MPHRIRVLPPECVEVFLNMLGTSEQFPEPIDNESDARDSSATGNNSGTSITYRNDSLPEEFLSSKRTGRRNALTYPETGMVDLPDRFVELSVETAESNNVGRDPNAPSTSKQRPQRKQNFLQ